MINREILEKLIRTARDDDEIVEFIRGCLKSFCEYYYAIYEMETNLMLYNPKDMGREEWQSLYSRMDKNRSDRHNAAISSIRMLNRLAEKDGMPLVYDNVVSEEKPYRREIADAVLAYVETIIKERR